MTTTHNQEPAYDHKLLNLALIKEAEKYLWDELKTAMEKDIKSIATKAVANWAEIKFSKDSITSPYSTSINIAFVEHIVNTVIKENPISINVKESNERFY